MAWPSAKRKARKRTETKPVRSRSAVKIKKQGSLYAVTINGRIVSKFMPKASAQKKAAEIRIKRKNPPPAPRKRAAKVAKEILKTFDVDRDGELDKGDIRLIRGNPVGKIYGVVNRWTLVKPLTGRAESAYYIIIAPNGHVLVDKKGKAWKSTSVAAGRKKLQTVAVKTNPGWLSTLAEAGIAITSAIEIAKATKGRKPKKRTPAKRKERKPVRSRSAKKKNPGSRTAKKAGSRSIRIQSEHTFRVKNAVRRIGKKLIARRDGFTLHRYTKDPRFQKAYPLAPKTYYLITNPKGHEVADLPSLTSAKSLFNHLAAFHRDKKKNPTPAVQIYRTYHRKGLAAAKAAIKRSKDLSADQKRGITRDLENYDRPPTIGARNPGGSFAYRGYKIDIDFTNSKLWQASIVGKKGRAITKPHRNYIDTVVEAEKIVDGVHSLQDRGKKLLKNPPSRPAKRPAARRAGQTAARKRNPSGGFEAFQGRPADRTLNLRGPANIPSHTWTLGRLHEIRVPGKTPIRFNGNGQKFYLLSDRNDRGLWIAGTRDGTIATPNPAVRTGEAKSLGKASHVVYETLKAHLDDVGPTLYEHKFGEEGGERPHFALDRDGYCHIIGGDFEITPLGIRD